MLKRGRYGAYLLEIRTRESLVDQVPKRLDVFETGASPFTGKGR